MRCVKKEGVYEYLGDGKDWEKRIDEIKRILKRR